MKVPHVLGFAAIFLVTTAALQSRVMGSGMKSAQDRSPAPQPPTSQPQSAVFEKPIPASQLTFLNNLAGRTSADVVKDKQFHKLLDAAIPTTLIHAGHDMTLGDAMEMALSGPGKPARIRDGRYAFVSSTGSPQYPSRGFVWVAMQEGIALGGFYFEPSNGEPTPTLTIVSKQLKEKTLAMGELPAAFAEDVHEWSGPAHASLLATRYFINASGNKYVLEHDEDYCVPANGAPAPAPDVCEKMNADAADIDLNAAYFMKKTDHASNATAYMLDPEQTAFTQFRDDTCRGVPNTFGCHIRMTREQTRVIVNRPRSSPPPRAPAPPPHK